MTYMISSLPHSSFCDFRKSLWHPKLRKCTQIRSQFFQDEGKSANVVDANLVMLKERIQELRRKELVLEKRGVKGWNYEPVYGEKHERQTMFLETMQVLGLVGTSVGLVFLFGSLGIFLVSLVVQLTTRNGI